MFTFAKKLMFARLLNFEKGNLTLLDQKVLIVPFSLMALLMQIYLKNKALERAVYNVMKDSVYNFCMVGDKRFHFKPKKLLEVLLQLTEMNGYGEIKVGKLDFEKKRVVFITKGLPSKTLEKKKNTYADTFWCGMLAGGMSYIFKDETIETLEIACVISGAPTCKFVAARKDFLSEKYTDLYRKKFGKYEPVEK